MTATHAQDATPSEPADTFCVRPWGANSWADNVPLSDIHRVVREAREAGLRGLLVTRDRDKQTYDDTGAVLVFDGDGGLLATHDTGQPFGAPRPRGAPVRPEAERRSESVQVLLTSAEVADLDARRGALSRSAWLAAPLRR
jgi:hypothetical protein